MPASRPLAVAGLVLVRTTHRGQRGATIQNGGKFVDVRHGRACALAACWCARRQRGDPVRCAALARRGPHSRAVLRGLRLAAGSRRPGLALLVHSAGVRFRGQVCPAPRLFAAPRCSWLCTSSGTVPQAQAQLAAPARFVLSATVSPSCPAPRGRNAVSAVVTPSRSRCRRGRCAWSTSRAGAQRARGSRPWRSRRGYAPSSVATVSPRGLDCPPLARMMLAPRMAVGRPVCGAHALCSRLCIAHRSWRCRGGGCCMASSKQRQATGSMYTIYRHAPRRRVPAG